MFCKNSNIYNTNTNMTPNAMKIILYSTAAFSLLSFMPYAGAVGAKSPAELKQIEENLRKDADEAKKKHEASKLKSNRLKESKAELREQDNAAEKDFAKIP